MSRHPGLPPERSGSNDFFSDANLDLRAQPAGYADFAPLPGESLGDALAGSPALQSVQRHGGPLQPLQLAEVEVDDGGRSADQSGWLDSSEQATHSTLMPAASVDGDGLDRLADLLVERITKRLGG